MAEMEAIKKKLLEKGGTAGDWEASSQMGFKLKISYGLKGAD